MRTDDGWPQERVPDAINYYMSNTYSTGWYGLKRYQKVYSFICVVIWIDVYTFPEKKDPICTDNIIAIISRCAVTVLTPN